jgi:small ligand-binding sensory domain FIST
MSSAVSRKTVVGGDREVESGPAVAVWLASLPEPVETFHMEFVRTSEGGVFGGYRFEETAPGAYLLIGDPFSFPADLLLRHLNERIPGTIVIGGMASGGTGPDQTQWGSKTRVNPADTVGSILSPCDLSFTSCSPGSSECSPDGGACPSSSSRTRYSATR